MAGRHLRGARRPDPRTVLALVGVLVLGLVLGAGGSLLFEDAPVRVDTDDADDPDDAGDGEPGEGRAALEPVPGPLTLAFVGDVRADGPLVERLADAPEDFVGAFGPVLRDADLAVASLDTLVADPGAPDADDGSAPPALLDVLAAAGVDVVSVANDRTVEDGVDGVYRMLAAKEARGDGMLIGVGVDEDEAYAPFVRQIGGVDVAVIAATQLLEGDQIAEATAGPDTPGLASAKRVDRLVAEVRAARSAADVVVVVVHWGVAGETCPSTGQQELADALVAAGADVVTGAGAGRAQGAGRLDGAVVGYGLGGFLGEGGEPEEVGVLLVRVDAGGVLDYEWRPGRTVDGVPEPLTGDEAGTATDNWEFRRTCTNLTP